MATIKQCDRCGAVYQRKKPDALVELIHSFTGVPLWVAIEETLHIDLCPECTKSLVEWTKQGGDPDGA